VKHTVRITRIIVSASVLTLFICVFLGDDSSTGIVKDTLLCLQFMPSLVLLISHPGLSVGMGLIFIIIACVVFGRVYCSFLCPLGILQDIFIRLSRISGIKKTHSFQKSYPRIRYGIAVLTMMMLCLGSMAIRFRSIHPALQTFSHAPHEAHFVRSKPKPNNDRLERRPITAPAGQMVLQYSRPWKIEKNNTTRREKTVMTYMGQDTK